MDGMKTGSRIALIVALLASALAAEAQVTYCKDIGDGKTYCTGGTVIHRHGNTTIIPNPCRRILANSSGQPARYCRTTACPPERPLHRCGLTAAAILPHCPRPGSSPPARMRPAPL
jgi:hypothetical protein